MSSAKEAIDKPALLSVVLKLQTHFDGCSSDVRGGAQPSAATRPLNRRWFK